MKIFYRNNGLDLLQDGPTLPSLGNRYLHQNIAENCCFFLYGEKHSDLEKCLKLNILGGLSMVFCRYQEKGVTHIRHPDGPLCQQITGLDANSLYLWSLSQEMPVGEPLRYRRLDDSSDMLHCEKVCITCNFSQNSVKKQ